MSGVSLVQLQKIWVLIEETSKKIKKKQKTKQQQQETFKQTK